jgi:hypothetical protein
MNVDPPKAVPHAAEQATHLAALANQLHRRRLPFATEPLEVDPETFHAAREEMAAVMRERGFPLRAADIGRPNFLLLGVPICPRES